MNTFLRLLDLAAWTMLIAFIIISAFSFYHNMSPSSLTAFKAKFKNAPITVSAEFAVFTVAYQLVTPAWTFEWYGSKDNKTWILEQIPMPDSRDILFLWFVWLLFFIAARIFWLKSEWNPLLKTLIIIISFVIITGLGWLLFKSLAYILMLYEAKRLGISITDLNAIRTMDFKNTSQYIGMGKYLSVTFMSALALLITLIANRNKNDE